MLSGKTNVVEVDVACFLSNLIIREAYNEYINDDFLEYITVRNPPKDRSLKSVFDVMIS